MFSCSWDHPLNEDCKFLVVNRLQRCKLLSPAIYCQHSAQLSLSYGRHKSGGGQEEKTRGAGIYFIIKIYVVLYQVSSLSLSQSEDLKTIKGIPIDTVVVIVCVKKTDSDGLAMVAVVFVSGQCYLSTLQWSDNTRIQTLPGLLSHSDPHILINSFVFLEPIIKSLLN